YNLGIMGVDDNSISYELNSGIQFGDEIKYVLTTDYGVWVRRDTITKTYGELTVQVQDNADATTNWTGNWSTTSTTFYSASKSFTDSPSSNYQNNANSTYVFNDNIDLSDATGAMVSFYAKWNI